MERLSQNMSTMMTTASSFLPRFTPREKLFVHPNHPRRKRTQQLRKPWSLKQDHWILDKKNKQLIRVRTTPRKALFTPTGAKECPINPDNIIVEDNWRLTSQANKPMINLWIGTTIFTFADNPLKDDLQQTGSSTKKAG